jgi:HK97 gp10 family phage protein
MAKVIVEIEGGEKIVAELRRRGLNATEAVERIFHAGAEIFADEAASKVRNTSQTVAKNIRVETIKRSRGKIEVWVGPYKKAAWFAHFIERGTKPHVIRPRKRKALLLDEGRFAATVWHPGMAARPFMRPTFDEKNQAVQREIGAQLKRVINK